MDVSNRATLGTGAYSQQSASRLSECDQLVTELGGLHPILDRDLARIEAIAGRLRQLADDQRRDIIPGSSIEAHKVWLWRRMDVHARRAEDLLNSGGWAQESLDAEYQDLLSRGSRITDYDTALMTLSGEPLSGATVQATSRFKISIAQVVTGLIGLVIAGLVAVLFAHGLIIAGVVIAIYALRVFHRVGDQIFPSLADVETPPRVDSDQRCPGFLPYRVVLDREILALNEHLKATDSASAKTSDFQSAIGVYQNFLSKVKRINPPPVLRPIHELQLALVEGWLRVFQGVLDGAPVDDEVHRVHELTEQTNELILALDSQCLGS